MYRHTGPLPRVRLRAGTTITIVDDEDFADDVHGGAVVALAIPFQVIVASRHDDTGSTHPPHQQHQLPAPARTAAIAAASSTITSAGPVFEMVHPTHELFAP